LSILIPLGEYFQVQDDFLDCYGKPEHIGKIGTDILVRASPSVDQHGANMHQDNKCSWNINTALAHATPAQRAVLDEHYGRKNPESEAKVKEVFSQEPISIPERYECRG
jgi:farnesyl diphosphate synthase